MKKHLALLAASVILSATVGFADIVVPSNGLATLTNLNSAAINNNGAPFFDNKSADGAKCGIGYLLTGASLAGCGNVNGNLHSLPRGNDVYSYLNVNGAHSGNFSFTADGATSTPSHALTLHVELAGWAAQSSFGYKNLTTGGGPVELFSASTNNPAFASLNVVNGQNFAFYYKLGSKTWWTNGDGLGSKPFALFTQNSATNGFKTGAYVLGMEDSTDADFQDMIVSIRVVPEPAAVGALGAAVLATVLAARRRHKAA
jgi:hypothetical protein